MSDGASGSHAAAVLIRVPSGQGVFIAPQATAGRVFMEGTPA